MRLSMHYVTVRWRPATYHRFRAMNATHIRSRPHARYAEYLQMEMKWNF